MQAQNIVKTEIGDTIKFFLPKKGITASEILQLIPVIFWFVLLFFVVSPVA